MVVKQGCLSPEPVTHLRPDVPASNPSSPGAEAGCGGHRRDRARGARRSPLKKKNKFSGRNKSPPTERSRSLHYVMITVKQEREDHPWRGGEDRPHQKPSEQEQRRACSNRERDRHRGHSRQRRSSGEWQVSGQGRDRDSQILQAQEKERDCYNARHREHRQQNEGAGSEAQEAIPRPAGNRSKEVAVKEKPSFELSGALLEDTNTFWDVVIKYNESPEARIPQNGGVSTPLKMMSYFRSCSSICRVLTFWVKISAPPTLHIDHPSCSKHHAVFQYWLVEYTRADGTVGRRVKPCIIDRGSGNGTFLNTKAY